MNLFSFCFSFKALTTVGPEMVELETESDISFDPTYFTEADFTSSIPSDERTSQMNDVDSTTSSLLDKSTDAPSSNEKQSENIQIGSSTTTTMPTIPSIDEVSSELNEEITKDAEGTLEELHETISTSFSVDVSTEKDLTSTASTKKPRLTTIEVTTRRTDDGETSDDEVKLSKLSMMTTDNSSSSSSFENISEVTITAATEFEGESIFENESATTISESKFDANNGELLPLQTTTANVTEVEGDESDEFSTEVPSDVSDGLQTSTETTEDATSSIVTEVGPREKTSKSTNTKKETFVTESMNSVETANVFPCGTIALTKTNHTIDKNGRKVEMNDKTCDLNCTTMKTNVEMNEMVVEVVEGGTVQEDRKVDDHNTTTQFSADDSEEIPHETNRDFALEKSEQQQKHQKKTTNLVEVTSTENSMADSIEQLTASSINEFPSTETVHVEIESSVIESLTTDRSKDSEIPERYSDYSHPSTDPSPILFDDNIVSIMNDVCFL